MSRKHKNEDWAGAKKLCRLNLNDIIMAKRLGFHPDALIRATPNPKQKWKLPVNAWVRDLHRERFGFVWGETQEPAPKPVEVVSDEEAARIFGEQLYWEDYWERNADEPATGFGASGKPAAPPGDLEITDEDVPF